MIFQENRVEFACGNKNDVIIFSDEFVRYARGKVAFSRADAPVNNYVFSCSVEFFAVVGKFRVISVEIVFLDRRSRKSGKRLFFDSEFFERYFAGEFFKAFAMLSVSRNSCRYIFCNDNREWSFYR